MRVLNNPGVEVTLSNYCHVAINGPKGNWLIKVKKPQVGKTLMFSWPGLYQAALDQGLPVPPVWEDWLGHSVSVINE